MRTERRRAKPSNARVWAAWCLGLLTVLLLRVWQHVEAIRLETRLKGLRLEADRLTYENGRLRTQIHQWTSTSHLETLSRERYAMGPLDPKRVIGLQP